jgi:hypothetical protein
MFPCDSARMKNTQLEFARNSPSITGLASYFFSDILTGITLMSTGS